MHLTIHSLGWCGALLVLLAYALVSTRRVDGDSYSFQSLNILGGALLLSNTAYLGAYPSSFVNAVWIGIAAFALYRSSRQRVVLPNGPGASSTAVPHARSEPMVRSEG